MRNRRDYELTIIQLRASREFLILVFQRFCRLENQGVFTWRRASPLGRASPPWRDLAIDYPRSRLGRLEISI